MKKTIFLFLVLINCSLISNASHFLGGNFTCIYTGSPNQYLVRLKLFRDCNAISISNTWDICYSSQSTSQQGNITLILSGNPTVIGHTFCNANPTNSCPGGQGEIEVYQYEGIVDLPNAATDWKFSWSGCCRSASITNLIGGGGQGVFIDATLDNIAAPTNDLPIFNSFNYLDFCVGNIYHLDVSATDLDGDSLVYSLVDPLDEPFFQCPSNEGPVLFTSPYTALSPFSSSIPISLDSITGILTFSPSQVEVASIAVLVSEYRNGLLIGKTRNDFILKFISNCANIIPTISSQPTAISICEDDSAFFNVTTSANASNFQWQRKINGVFSDIIDDAIFQGATTNTLNINNPPLWFNNRQFFCKIVGPCGSVLNTDTVRLYINPKTPAYLNIDTILCLNSVPFQLDSFVIPPGGIFNGNGIVNSTFYPLQVGLGAFTINYVYTNNYGCVSSSLDTIIVDLCSALDEQHSINVSIYPNPTSNFLQLNGLQNQSLVAIYDVTGKLVLQAEVDKNSNNSINIASLSPGFYHCRIQQNNQTAELSFIKK